MIDHMEYDKKKFYPIADNATKVQIGSKVFYAHPKYIFTKSSLTVYSDSDGNDPYYQDFSNFENTKLKCYGIAGNSYVVGYNRDAGQAFIKMTDATPIWGGRILAMIKHALACMKGAIAC